MDVIIRWLGLLILGLALLLANYWFVRAVHQQIAGRDVVILPFGFATGSDKKGRRGLALARLFGSRLASIQGDFARMRWSEVAATPPDRHVPGTAADPIDAIALILPQTVELPASLFEPLDLSLSVAGVEVGGLLAQAQRLLVARRTLSFIVIPKDEDRAIVTADLAPLLGPRHRWFAIESDARPDEIATNLAYAVVQRRIAEDRLAAIGELDPPAFVAWSKSWWNWAA
jgi:hypothetical protein